MGPFPTAVLVLMYLTAIVVANLSVAHFGPWIAPINAFSLIGLDLVLRDGLHDRWRNNNLGLKMMVLIVGGGLVSMLLNPAAGMIAVASSAAFMLAAMADGAVYHLLRNRSWLQRANVSNVAGAAVDSVVFPWIAFGGLDWRIVGAMFIAKVFGGAVWSALLDWLGVFQNKRPPQGPRPDW